MSEHDDLLRRFIPVLKYDSNEQYFADSPAQWTDNPGNELRQAERDGQPGRLIAKPPKLTLAFLGPKQYADGTRIEKGDFIGDTRRDYREHYVKLRMARPDLTNRTYGRAVEANGRLWLQYWLWYFYNDYSLALNAGLHEGDWEMIQLRMHDGEPDVAVYAQHTHAQKRAWKDVEKADGRPVVYVARGSHASYFSAGFHHTEAWYDIADGKRKPPRLTLEILEGAGPGWALWPGRWGDTRPRLPGGVHQPSPTGPGSKAQWRNPDALLAEARAVERREAPEAPEVSIQRIGDLLRVEFDFERRDPPPGSLVLTVNSRDEAGVPPQTFTFELGATIRGRLDTRIPLDPTKHYDVYTSTTAGDPPVPSESTFIEVEPVGPKERPPFVQRLTQRLSGVLAWFRGHLRRR
jgi:hypothetical protein